LDIIRQRLIDLSGDTLFDETTPKFETLFWLVLEDPANLDLINLPDDDLRERYVSALFYFIMDGDGWENGYGFLSSTTVCEWNDESTGMGVFCDENDSVREIAMSKSMCARF
jgi:hypothetical protein